MLYKFRLSKKEIFLILASFILGIIAMYHYNWKWINNSKALTEDLVINFRENYDVQENLKKNYSDAYIVLSDILMDCIAKQSECNADDIAKELGRITSEREDLNLQLDNSNKKIETVLSKFPQK